VGGTVQAVVTRATLFRTRVGGQPRATQTESVAPGAMGRPSNQP
jgi:hypothetical protein